MPKSHDRPRSVPSVMPSLIFNLIQSLVCLLYVCILYRRTSIILSQKFQVYVISFCASFSLSFFLFFSLYFFPKDTRFASTTCI